MAIFQVSPEPGNFGSTIDYTIRPNEYGAGVIEDTWDRVRDTLNWSQYTNRPDTIILTASIWSGSKGLDFATIERSFMSFNTSPIPVGATINSVKLILSFSAKENTLGVVERFEIGRWQMSFGANSNHVNNWNDIDHGTSLGFITFTDIVIGTPTVTLLQTPIHSYVSAGMVGLSLLHSNDFYNSSPSWIQNRHIYGVANSADQAPGIPLLEIDYSVSGPSSNNIVMVI